MTVCIVRTSLFLAILFAAVACSAAEIRPGTNVFESPVPPTPQCEIDKLVFSQLTKLNIQPALCSDAVFVRRAHLDIIGTLPTAREAREFIEDPDEKNKRRLLIDRLLERPEFADYWAMKWGDILRIKAEFPVNLWPNAAQAYSRWVRASLASNKPYDQFVREMLTSSGSNFRVGPVNFYRAIQNRTPEGIAGAVALTFMGTRIDSWPSNRVAGMAAFFSQIGYKPTSEWKEEHVFWDPLGVSRLAGSVAAGRAAVAGIADPSNTVTQVSLPLRTNAPPSEAMFPDGTTIKLPPDRDPREVFGDWLINSKNRWFTRSIVNRIWAWLLGRGIIQEPDDIRDDNPPSNPALLAYLEKEMIAGHYDLKRFYRLVLNSQTYQFASTPRSTAPEAEANFASYKLRRLDAEVLSDAINKVTGTSDLYTSPIPEPFTYIPKGMAAVDIADGSITSPFLAMFGRSARATGMENERNNRPTPAQWLFLLNSSDIQRKIEQGPRLQAIYNSRRRQPQLIQELYLAILSRFPTPDEIETIEAYGGPLPPKPKARVQRPAGTNSAVSNIFVTTVTDNRPRPGPAGSLGTARKSASAKSRSNGKSLAQRPKRRDEWIDIAWSLINSEEFLYRH